MLNHYNQHTLFFLFFSDCKTGADILYSGAAALGCQPFIEAQEKACTCDASSTSPGETDTKPSKKDDVKMKKSKPNSNQSQDFKNTKVNKESRNIKEKQHNKRKDEL